MTAEGYAAHEETVRHGRDSTRIAVALESAIPQPGDTFADALASGGEGPRMVVVPAGSFRMGCVTGGDCPGDERPVHEVAIRQALALSVYEVTFSDWDACTNAGGCNRYRPDDRGWGRGNRPVINVSWEDAQSYVSWLSRETGEEYRLPSASEWEYAARAGTATRYSWGNEIGANRANCDGCGSQWDDDRTALVGSFAANPWGLHDMHGNVLEWVEDCWNGSYGGAPSDGSAWLRGDCAKRVLRGGSWLSFPTGLRSGNRNRNAPGYRLVSLGFRVARTLTPWSILPSLHRIGIGPPDVAARWDTHPSSASSDPQEWVSHLPLGLAPVTRESGTWKGRSFIRGGRSRPRRMLFMAAVSASTHKPDLARKYLELRDRGKPPKVAPTAVMCKLVVLANALLKAGSRVDAEARWSDRLSPAMAGATACRPARCWRRERQRPQPTSGLDSPPSAPHPGLGPSVRSSEPPLDKVHSKTPSEQRPQPRGPPRKLAHLHQWILTLRWNHTSG